MVRLVMILMSLIVWREDAAGASYYISPTGSDANTCTGTTDALACATFQRCAIVMVQPGDTCYALDGTYTVTGTNGWEISTPAGSATQYKRFTSLSQDPTKVTIKPSAPRDHNTITLIATPGSNTAGDYVEFDHLTLEGRSVAEGSPKNFRVHHNILRCPDEGTGSSGNNSMWFIYGATDDMLTGVWVYNNRFVLETGCSTYGGTVGEGGDGYNIQLLGTFYTDGAIIENNDFINTAPTGNMFAQYFSKRGDKNLIVRNNYFLSRYNQGTSLVVGDCLGDDAATCLSNAPPPPVCNNNLHNNVLVNGNLQVDTDCSKSQHMWNNTVINPDIRCFGVDVGSTANGNGTNHSAFNNICYCVGAGSCDEIVGIPFYGGTTWGCVADQLYLDNNMYYPDTKPFRDCNGFTANSLVAWKAHLAASTPTNPNVRETNSRNTDPLFVNVGAGNYHLQSGSPAASGGRGAGYPAYLGAHAPDNSNVVGCSFLSTCYGYTAPTLNPRSKVR